MTKTSKIILVTIIATSILLGLGYAAIQNCLKDLDLYSDYGFYEAYDHENKGVVKSYFAHHQGMSLLGLTNYLKQLDLMTVIMIL